MSYRSYIGASTTQGLTNATWSFPTSLMMYDIAALQYMYGANYYNAGHSTVYSWNPNTGQEFINGVAQAAPGGNTIFMTVWDGGGTNTYDFSNYATNLSVNLNPGAWTITSAAQLANLGAGHIAIGNIANAYLYNNNTASLVQNAVGGAGNDTIIGNAADNKLTGGHGNDIIDGQAGTNTAVYSGPSSAYQQTHNADGSWTITDLRTGSPDGTDTLTNIQLLQFSDTTVTIGTVAPPPVVAAPIITSFSPDSASVGDGITNANILTLTGTAQANCTIKVYDGVTLLGSVTANSSGAWSYTTTAALLDGSHSLTATATDSSNNTSAPSSVTSVIVDTVAPVQPTVVLNSVDSGVVGDGITNVNVISLTGTAEINSTIKIYDGATLLGSAIANAEGVWNFVANMADDQYAAPTQTATITDVGRSFMGDGGGGLVMDRSIQGATSAAGSSDVRAIPVSTTDPLAQATAANATQAFGFTTGPLPDGVHNFTTTSTDAAGNVSSTSAVLAITVDTTTPTGGTPDLVAGSDSGSSTTDNLTNVTSPSFTVALNPTVAAGDTVQLLLGGSALAHNVTHTITAAEVTAGSVSLAVTAGDLGVDGSKSISAKFTDTAGNTSTTTALAVTLDTTAPVVTEGLTSDTGSSASDKITANGTLTGTGDANAVVTFKEGSTTLGTTTANASGVWSFTPTGLADGAHTIVASETDTAGNTGTSSLTFTLDTTAPVVTESLTSDTGSSASDKITANGTLTGTGDANAVVTIKEGSTDARHNDRQCQRGVELHAARPGRRRPYHRGQRDRYGRQYRHILAYLHPRHHGARGDGGPDERHRLLGERQDHRERHAHRVG